MALPRKMSAKLVEMMARMPHARSAHGAWSRGAWGPERKLSPTSWICLPALTGSSMKDGGTRRAPSGVKRQSKNSASARFALSVILRNRAGQIWSVSMLDREMAMTRLVVLLNGSGMSVGLHGRSSGGGSPQYPRIRDYAGDGAGSSRSEERRGGK